VYRFTWAAALAAGFTLVLAVPAAADAATAQTLTVVGNGKVFVTPDVADLSVSVTRKSATSRQSLSSANRVSDAIVTAVEALGVPASDIQTQNVNVFSFTHKHHKRWEADESVGVHITNVKLVGPVIDAATHAGASSVSGPSFSFSNPSTGVEAANRAAIIDAQAQANDAAAAIGYKVTGVQSIDLNPQSGPIVAQGSAAPVSAKAPKPSTPTSIHPGTQEVDAQVSIVFTIAPA
jgi:hypothetical protein